MCLLFARLDEKHPIVRKIWEIWENFQKNSLKNCLKCITLAYFQKNLTNPVLLFGAFGRKLLIVGKFWENFENFWWKFNRKIEFLASFGKVVAKNRSFGNNTIFLQQFFRFRGGRSLCSPLAAPMHFWLEIQNSFNTLHLNLISIAQNIASQWDPLTRYSLSLSL